MTRPYFFPPRLSHDGGLRDPHEEAPRALKLTQHSWGYALLDVASRLCMHYTHDLSQKKCLLVQGCVNPLGNLLDFSYRHGLAGDAIATPSRPWPLDKLHGRCSLSRNQPCKGCHPTLQQRPLREYLS